MNVLIERIKERRTEDLKTQERLAETYFNTTEKKRPAPAISGRSKALAIAGLSLLFVLFASVVTFFYTHTVDVDVDVDRKTGLLSGNLINTQEVKAYGRRDNKRACVLPHNTPTDSARAFAINLKEGADFTKKYLSIIAYTKRGGGRIKVILRDRYYRSYESSTITIHDIEMEEQTLIVAADKTRNSIDLQNIRQIRFEPVNGPADSNDAEIFITKVSFVGGKK